MVMNMKDKMLTHIKEKVYYLMNTTTFDVVPYSELSMDVFMRVKQYFASDAQYSDVVCLVSTSILEPGKSGILFTTEYIYCKNWGVLTNTYKNRLDSPEVAEFSSLSEFDICKMKELMLELKNIEVEEARKKQREKVLEDVIELGAMFITAYKQSTEKKISENNKKIEAEIKGVADEDNE